MWFDIIKGVARGGGGFAPVSLFIPWSTTTVGRSIHLWSAVLVRLWNVGICRNLCNSDTTSELTVEERCVQTVI